MDQLRSCYSTRMQFDPTGQAPPVLVRWYFTDPTTPVFTAETPFRSSNYRDWKMDGSPLGEVENDPRPWRNGSAVGSAVPRVGQFCGTLDQWAAGIEQPWPDVPLNTDDTPLCCNPCNLEGRGFDCGFAGGYE